MKKSNLYFLFIVILLTSTIVYSRTLAQTRPIPLNKAFKDFPKEIGEWRGEEHPFSPSVLNVLGADDYLNRTYLDKSKIPLWLYIGYYRSQKRGDQIHSPLHCYPGSGWNPVKHEIVPISLPDRTIHINRMTIQNADERRIVAYWYQSQDQIIANEYLQRLNLILSALRSNRTDGSLIRVSMNADAKTFVEDWKKVDDFIQDVYPILTDFLPE